MYTGGFDDDKKEVITIHNEHEDRLRKLIEKNNSEREAAERRFAIREVEFATDKVNPTAHLVRWELAKRERIRIKYAKGSQYDLRNYTDNGANLPRAPKYSPDTRPRHPIARWQYIPASIQGAATTGIGPVRSERREDIDPYDGLDDLRWDVGRRAGSKVLPEVPTSGHALTGWERTDLLGEPVSTDPYDWAWEANEDKVETITWMACRTRGCKYAERIPAKPPEWRLASDEEALASYKQRYLTTSKDVPRDELTASEIRDHQRHERSCGGELYVAGILDEETGKRGFTIPMARLTVQSVKVMDGPNGVVAAAAFPQGQNSSVTVRNADGKITRRNVSGVDGRRTLKSERGTVGKTRGATAGKKRVRIQGAPKSDGSGRRKIRVEAAPKRAISTIEIGAPSSPRMDKVRAEAEKMLASGLIG